MKQKTIMQMKAQAKHNVHCSERAQQQTHIVILSLGEKFKP
jgi:hypothetical protein